MPSRVFNWVAGIKQIAIATVLVCGVCASAAAQSLGCRPAADAVPISEIGAFSNMRFTAEHAYGYSLLVWRAGDCLIGFLLSSQGLAGDTPMGTLEDVKLDSGTGRLSFSARLTMGMISVPGSRDFTPSRDLFTFEGQLNGGSVSGAITHSIQNDSNASPARTDVVLTASPADAEVMHGSATYGDWMRKWQPVLQRRGPK